MEIIQQATSVVNEVNNCFFGLSGLQLCSYDPSNPTVYFSLGEAIAALGLIFAVYQLRKPIWNMTMQIRGFIVRYLHWALAVIGLLAILVSSLLPQFLITTPRILEYPLFWEVISFLSFTLSVFVLFFASTTKRWLFTQKNAERFYRVLLRGAAITRENHAEDVVNLVGSNLSKIVNLASRVPRFPDEKWDANKEPSAYALAILNIVLTEPQIIKYIATSRIDFLLHLIKELRINRLDHPDIRIFFREVTQELFDNSSSYFYRQLGFGGLGQEKPIYNALFRDQIMLDNFHPFSCWNYWRRDHLDKEYLKVYLQALETAIQGYWFDQHAGISYRAFHSAFDQLSHAAQSIASETKRKITDRFSGTENFWLLHEIASFYARTFPLIYTDAIEKKKVKDDDLKAKADADGYSECLTALYIDGLFGFFEALSYIDDHDDDVRSLAIDASNAVIDKHDSEDASYQGMRDRFLKLLWTRLEENVKGFYAPMIRVYISLILFPGITYPSWLQDERDKLLGLLYEKVLPIIQANPSDTDRFLPTFIEYNQQTKQFEWVSRGSKKTPPPKS